MNNTDWKKEMKEAGCQHMDFVKSAKEGVARAGAAGWAYRVVTVDLEIRLPNGFFSRSKVNVEMDRLDVSQNPGGLLCEEVLKPIKAAYRDAGIEETVDLNQDWMKALKDAGCRYMKYIKKVELEIVHPPSGDYYQAIVVYLEKEYSPGHTLRAKEEVDVALIKISPQPAVCVCEELTGIVNAMDKKAVQDEDAGSKMEDG